MGLTSESELEELISEKKETGVFLSMLGFGTGNLKDNKLEAQAVYMGRPPKDFYFAAAVAEFGLLVRDSAYKGESSFGNVKELLKKADTGEDPYREEFMSLVKTLEKNSIPE